jgi:hypothetical protein
VSRYVRDDLSSSLEEAIMDLGLGFGPSLIASLLYGPSGILLNEGERKFEIPISDEARDILIERSKIIKKIYGHIIPRSISNIFPTIGGREISYAKAPIFKIRNPEIIRSIFRDNYNNELPSDDEKDGILHELLSQDPINVSNTRVYSYYPKGNKYILERRFKSEDEIKRKLLSLYGTLSDDEREVYPEFLLRISSDDFKFWGNYGEYLEEFGDGILRTQIGDYFGMRIIDLDTERGKKNLERLGSCGLGINLRGFKIVPERFNDHRKRLDEGKPGGFHYTILSSDFPNFPIEFQYLDFVSAIRDRFGSKKHSLYSQRGKQ